MRRINVGLIALVLCACSSPKQVLETATPVQFLSTKSATDLTACIDRNTDGIPAGLTHTSVKSYSQDSFEIITRHGDFTGAVVLVKTSDKGSTALFYFSATEAVPDHVFRQMSKGCE